MKRNIGSRRRELNRDRVQRALAQKNVGQRINRRRGHVAPVRGLVKACLIMKKYSMVLRHPEIWNSKTNRPPRFVHETRESAEREAERLALEVGESMAILEIVAWVHPKKKEYRDTETLVPTTSYEPVPH